MNPIFEIIQELKSTSKRTLKIKILYEHKDNELLKRVFNLTLNPQFNFGIQEIELLPEEKNPEQFISLSELLDFLEFKCFPRLVVGNAAKEQLQTLLKQTSEKNRQLILSILSGNLHCGVSFSTISTVWNGLVELPKFMLASSPSQKTLSNLEFPNVIGQRKYDGMRVQISKKETSFILQTRNGSQIVCPEHLSSELLVLFSSLPDSIFLDGELLCYDSLDTIKIRQQGNGILNKLIQGTISKEELNNIHFIIWDWVDPLKNDLPYSERLKQLTQEINKNHFTYILLAEGKQLSSEEELITYFNQQLELGFEGIVVKNLSSLWEPKRSKHWIKYKDIKTADLRVKAIIPGMGKYKNMMGALELVSEDEKLSVSVGTGFSDAQRELLNNPKIIGRIVEVAYNSKISSKTKNKYSLYLPRFVQFRLDKNCASLSDEL